MKNVRWMMVGCALVAALLVGCRSREEIAPTPTTSPLPTPVESPLSAPGESPLPAPVESPLPEPRVPEPTEDTTVAAATTYLARSLEVAPDEVEVLSVEAVTWRDASLGCPREGMAYAQVLTPGYRVVLEAAGQRYELHTDEGGQSIVVCDPE